MPRTAALALCCLSAIAVAQTAPPPMTKSDELPTLLILNLEAQGVAPEQASAVTDAVVQALSKRGLFRVVSARDVATLISTERQRQLLSGCDAAECARDFGEAVSARYVLSGSVSKVGTALQLALQTLDTEKNLPAGRSSRIANDLQTLVGLVPYAASEATGTPLPPPKPRWMQYSMIGVGGGLILGGGIGGLYALSQQAVYTEEICPGGAGGCNGRNLDELQFYRRRDSEIGATKTVSLLSLALGAGLLAAGIYLMPPPEGGPRMAFVPSDRGVALVGEFP